MPKVTVKIDPSLCILAASCASIAPNLFQIGDETYVELTDAEGVVQGTEYTFDTTDAALATVQESADACPTQAISVQSVG